VKLIIAEKPELGRSIANAIPGAGKTENSCIYKGEYAIVWAYGHLLTLKDPEDYDPELKKWTLESLPIYYKDWQKKPNEQPMGAGKGISKEKRLSQIGELLKKCDCVIHAGDPDDEGQYLIDEILQWHHYTGKVCRINTNDTTPAALNKALHNLSDNTQYESRGWSAHARSVADIMVGYNCSRYFTLKNPGTLLTIGRVQTSTLGLVVNRDYQIENHVKQEYYEVVTNLSVDSKTVQEKYVPKKDDPNLDNGKITKRNYAEEKAGMLTGKVLSATVTYEEVTQQPPLPFNLTELQSYCSNKFGYDPTETMNITQTLRDVHSAITYNRSDCQYLTEEQYKEAPNTIEQVLQNIGGKISGIDPSIHSKCFNDSKITAHTAIIPQNKKIDITALNEKEKNVYLSICKYYLAQFVKPAIKGKTKLTASAPDGGNITATSTVVTFEGYLKLFKNDEKTDKEESSILSSIKPGTYTANVLDSHVESKETKPPDRYTKASLNKDMTRIAKYVTDSNVKKLLLSKDENKEGENGSIGTVATRGPIIDNLVERGYCEIKGKKLISTPLGRELYRILPDQLKKPDMTAYWWAIQEDITKGECDWHKLPETVLQMINEVIHTEYPRVNMDLIPAKYRRNSNGSVQHESLGICPRCGGQVIEGKKGFGCSNYKNGCKFVIWKTSKLPMMKNITISSANVKKWLGGGWVESETSGVRTSKNTVHSKRLYSSKKDSNFEGDLRLTDNANSEYGAGFTVEFQNDDKKKAKK
jgi:DNA topoisomerase-3